MNATQDRIAVTGNTYPVKDELKALGARWNGDLKAWMVPSDKAEEAQRIVAGAGPKQASSLGARSYRPSRCRDCGAAPSRYQPIYRNGQCKGCFVSDKEEAEMGY